MKCRGGGREKEIEVAGLCIKKDLQEKRPADYEEKSVREPKTNSEAVQRRKETYLSYNDWIKY